MPSPFSPPAIPAGSTRAGSPFSPGALPGSGSGVVYTGATLTGVGTAAGTSTGTVLTANASNNAKGAYSQLVAATAAACDGFVVRLGNAAGSRNFLIDIATGGAGVESVIVPDLPWSSGLNIDGADWLFVPLAVAAGTRLSARCQCSTGSSTVVIQLILAAGGLMASLTRPAAYSLGAVAGDSGGTQIDAGAAANTKGAWVALTAAAPADLSGFFVVIGNRTNTALTNGTFLVDIGIGGAGAEVVIVPDLFVLATATSGLNAPVWNWCPIAVASGTRIAARCQSTITDATDRLLDVALLAFG